MPNYPMKMLLEDDFENVNSLINSILNLYTNEEINQYSKRDCLYYYILCLLNLKLNKDCIKPQNNQLFEKIPIDTTIIRNEEEWLSFISSVSKPDAVIGNEIEYTLSKSFTGYEMREIRKIFVNQYPDSMVLSRTWYKLTKPLEKKIYLKNINTIQKTFNKSSMTLFYDKMRCKIRKVNDNHSWEVKIKLQEDKITYDIWDVNIKQSIEFEAYFGDIIKNKDICSIDKIYLGPKSILQSTWWKNMWLKNTVYLYAYLHGSDDERIALDIENNKIKYEIENKSFFEKKDMNEVANSAHIIFKSILGYDYWNDYEKTKSNKCNRYLGTAGKNEIHF